MFNTREWNVQTNRARTLKMKFDQNQKLTIATSQGCLLKAHHKLQPKYVNTQLQPSSWKHIHVQVTHPGCRNAVFFHAQPSWSSRDMDCTLTSLKYFLLVQGLFKDLSGTTKMHPSKAVSSLNGKKKNLNSPRGLESWCSLKFSSQFSSSTVSSSFFSLLSS